MPLDNNEKITFNVDQICSITKRLKEKHPNLVNVRKKTWFGLKVDRILYISSKDNKYKRYATPKEAVNENINVFFEMKTNEKGLMVAEFYYYPHLELCMSSGSTLQVFFADVLSLNEYLTNLNLHAKFHHLIH